MRAGRCTRQVSAVRRRVWEPCAMERVGQTACELRMQKGQKRPVSSGGAARERARRERAQRAIESAISCPARPLSLRLCASPFWVRNSRRERGSSETVCSTCRIDKRRGDGRAGQTPALTLVTLPLHQAVLTRECGSLRLISPGSFVTQPPSLCRPPPESRVPTPRPEPRRRLHASGAAQVH
ncbi:hypothetical protein BV20DRAFT_326472 [Pilatotrama ljubarskyi]|nr:hypothetical protein BV20DRAFT_326472 [Pilatotrama ljubarskyi]